MYKFRRGHRSRFRGWGRDLTVALAVTCAVGGAVPASAAIVGHLEGPNTSELASGIGNVQGWAFPSSSGDEIETELDVYIDGQFVMNVPCCSDRGDVKQVHPSAPVLSGFSGAFNFGSISPGPHTMEVHVYSKFGDHEVLTTNFTSERLGSYPYNKKFLWDDATADHCIPSNAVVNGETVARVACTDVEFTNGAGYTEHCAGTVELTWMKSSQGFRVTKGCDFIDYVKPPLEIGPILPGGGF